MEAEEKVQREYTDEELLNITESILFVAGDPVYIEELARLFCVEKKRMEELLSSAQERYAGEGKGVLLYVTDTTVQLVSNKAYDNFVVDFLQPAQIRSFSQSMLETLTIVAYRQPVTRSEIDAVRGVRSEYSVSQLIRLGYIEECGRKDVPGRPMLFCTTDKFLRKFGLHSLDELPEYEKFSEFTIAEDEDTSSQN